MKKFILLLTILFGITLNAQTIYYKANSFAYKYVNSYGYWTEWSDWESSNIKISIDYTNDIVNVFSDKHQTYLITKHLDTYTDSSGGQQLKFQVIDQDRDIGTMRLRVERNGNSQLYIEFTNIMWVYSGLREL